MMRRLNPGLVLASLVMLTLPAYGQVASPPLPDRNPQRGAPPAGDVAAAPVPEEEPHLPGDQPTLPWQSPKVNAALAACAKLLDGVAIDYEQLPPIRHGLCGAPAPILVKSIGKGPAVAIEPPATINCTLAAGLAAWLKNTVQPAAASLGTAVVKIRNAADYQCRNRYSGANTKISEHAFADALDVSEFVFASGQRLEVLGHWKYGVTTAALPPAPTPPQPNPHRVAEAAAEYAAVSSESTGAIVTVSARRTFGSELAAVTRVKTNPFVRPMPPPVARPPQSPLPHPLSAAGVETQASSPIASIKSNPFVSPLPAPGAEAEAPDELPTEATDTKSDPSPPPKARKLEPEEETAFLLVVHAEACKTFETVLGPDANEAHKNHFHLDMKKRRYVKICE
jgi:hypothetical protein